MKEGKKITNEERESRFQNASEAIQKLYNDEECGLQLKEIFNRHNLPEEKYKPYATSVGDIILNFYPKAKLPELLENSMSITKEAAVAIAKDLAVFLEPVKNTEVDPSSQTTHGNVPAGRQTSTQKKKVLPADQTPRYRKPLTNTPRYDGGDPYREPVDD